MARHVRTTRYSVPGAALAAALLLAGCGGGGSAGSASASTSKQLTGADLVAAAKKEGSVTFYTSYTAAQASGLIKAFAEKYPGVKVNMLQGTADKLTARLNVEHKAGTHNADLFQGDASYAEQLIKAGALQPYTPPDAPDASNGVDLPKGYANVDAVLTTVIAYNPTAAKQAGLAAPTSLEDLTKPEWRGHFSADATAVNWYESLINSMGHDKALALMKALGANKPQLVESHTLALTQVQSGEPVATVAAYGYLGAARAEKGPDTLAIVNPDPLPSAPDAIEEVQGAPHPHAAELFMNWLLSQEGQQTLIDTSNRISLRSDVKNDPSAWNPDKWKPAWSLPGASPADFNSYTTELKNAFGAT